MKKKIFNWLFRDEIAKLKSEFENINSSLVKSEQKILSQSKVLDYLLQGVDLSVDVHENSYSNSWAVISLQGVKTDYIKFIDLGNKDIKEIQGFLRYYEKAGNIKVDASPRSSEFLKIRRY